MTVNEAPQEQAKSASNVSRRTLTSGCGLAGALCILIAILGWNMICNLVAVVVVINLGFSLYYGYKAEQLLKIKEAK